VISENEFCFEREEAAMADLGFFDFRNLKEELLEY
jgi:hypothetical protein